MASPEIRVHTAAQARVSALHRRAQVYVLLQTMQVLCCQLMDWLDGGISRNASLNALGDGAEIMLKRQN